MRGYDPSDPYGWVETSMRRQRLVQSALTIAGLAGLVAGLVNITNGNMVLGLFFVVVNVLNLVSSWRRYGRHRAFLDDCLLRREALRMRGETDG